MTDTPVPAAGSKKTYLIIGAVVLGLIIIGGIGRAISGRFGDAVGEDVAERMLERATGGKVDIDADGDTVTVKTDQGTWSTSDKLPDGFPSDVPVYTRATVTASVAGQQDQKDGAYVAFATSDALEDVVTFYRSALADKGWALDSQMAAGDMAILVASKDTRKLSVTVTRESDTTSIAIGIGTE